MERKSFVFYESWWTAIKNLPRDIQGDVLTAIIEYGLYGETTDNLKPIAKAMLAMAKSQIDANTKRYLNGLKGAESGKLGGRPPKSKTPKKPLKNPKETPNVNDNVNDNVNVLSPPNPQGGVDDVAGAKEKILKNFFSKQIALEQFCMSERTSPEELRRLAEAIFAEWELVNERDVSEKHLINALRIKIRISHETNRPLKVDRLSERRGTPPDVSGQEDYSDTL